MYLGQQNWTVRFVSSSNWHRIAECVSEILWPLYSFAWLPTVNDPSIAHKIDILDNNKLNQLSRLMVIESTYVQLLNTWLISSMRRPSLLAEHFFTLDFDSQFLLKHFVLLIRYCRFLHNIRTKIWTGIEPEGVLLRAFMW